MSSQDLSPVSKKRKLSEVESATTPTDAVEEGQDKQQQESTETPLSPTSQLMASQKASSFSVVEESATKKRKLSEEDSSLEAHGMSILIISTIASNLLTNIIHHNHSRGRVCIGIW